MGQTKPVKVFTFMIKNSAEEKMIQSGKRKLVLDHLIVQKMDDEDSGNNVESMLSYGARALFEDDNDAGNHTCVLFIYSFIPCIH